MECMVVQNNSNWPYPIVATSKRTNFFKCSYYPTENEVSGGEAYIFAVAMVRPHTNMTITIPTAIAAKYELLRLKEWT